MTAAPLVSLIIANYNGAQHLPDCLGSVAALEFPRDSLEVILVDNASTDDSVAVARRVLPGIRILSQPTNTGFAPANNAGARVARGEYLAFLNNDARVPPDWLNALLAPFTAGEPDLACVASTLVSWDGQQIDFIGGAVNAYGRAFQVAQSLPYEPGNYCEPRELFFACGGAMLIRRAVFEDVGGFDADFIAYFEDVDLGWRLWLLGYRIVLAPAAVARHRLHATGARLGTHRRFAMSELNALRMITKNYSDETLPRVLSAALLLGAQRSVLHGQVDRREYDFPGPLDAAVDEAQPFSRLAASYVVAMSRFADELPYWLAKRSAIQSRRVRSDAELFAKFPFVLVNPISPWRRHVLVQRAALDALGVAVPVQTTPGRHLLIISHETIGPKMAGPGVRCLEMARALSAYGPVTLAAPGQPQADAAGVRLVGYQTPGDLEAAINSADAVLAIGQMVSRMPRLRQLDRPLIVDWYDPFEIEKLAQAEAVAPEFHTLVERESHLDLNLQARAGDFFICASERQRDYWLGVLLACGRGRLAEYAADPTLRTLIDVVPFGLPAQPPRRTAPAVKGVLPSVRATDRLLYWGGGLWQWFDPFTLLEALARIVAQRDDVKVFFAAGRHFNMATVPDMPIYAQTVEKARALDLLDRYVFFGDWVPYAERANYLLEADLGVSLHRDGLESRFAFRTRFLDYIWAGLPMVVTQGDPLAELVQQRDLGRVVPPGDVDALTAAILELLSGDARRELAPRFAAVAESLTWEAVVQPIVRFMQAPRFAPDARRALDDLELASRVKQLEETLTQINQGRVMRLLRWLDRLRRF
jgi:GT2 family glycosyltransferase